MDITIRPKIGGPPPDTANPNHNTRIGPKITVFLLMIVSLSLIGLFPDAQAQTVTANVTGDPFTIGEGNSTLSVYEFSTPLSSYDSISSVPMNFLGSHRVDTSERLVFDSIVSTNPISILIDLNATLGELQQTINPGGNFYSEFNYNFTAITNTNGNINIYLAVFDNDVIVNGSIGTGTGLYLLDTGNPVPQNPIRLLPGSDPAFFDTDNADKNIGYIIFFNDPVSFDVGDSISLDFSSFESDGTPINHITRAFDYSTPEPEPQGQAQTVTPTITGDPFTVGEGNSTLNFYSTANNIVDTDNSILQQSLIGPFTNTVDSSERLSINFPSTADIEYLFIPLNTTLGELQQTIGSGSPLPAGSGMFNYNVTSLTTQDGITNIYLAVFDDDVIINGRLGAGTAVPLIEDAISERSVTTHLDTVPVSLSYDPLYNSTLAGKSIGYIIEFNSPVSVEAGSNPISLDFSLFDADGVAINHITRIGDTTPEPEPQGQAQDTPTITGDPFTVGEGNNRLNVYSSSHNPIGTDDTILGVPVFGPRLSTVDSSERLIYNAVGSGRTILIDMNTTLSELQQTIGSGSPLPAGSGVFDYNVTSLTTQDGITSIYLGIFDDGAVILEGSYLAGSGIAVPLIENATSERSVTIHLDTVPVSPSYDPLYNSTLADKNIGYIIHFNEPVTFSGEQPISLDFNTFDDTNTPVNHINRQTSQPAPPSFADSSLPDVPVEATGPLTDIRPALDANVPAATASDGTPVIPTHNASASYPLGTHTITWTATDDQGLTNTITQRVIVTDTQPPTAQETTRQNLVNAIAARQAAIDQQTIIVNYWSDSNNPFADDRTLAQARIDHANSHITQSTIQLNSYQAQLDQILNP